MLLENIFSALCTKLLLQCNGAVIAFLEPILEPFSVIHLQYEFSERVSKKPLSAQLQFLLYMQGTI